MTDLLKLTEAAMVARVSLRDIDRVVDEHLLPDGFVVLDNGRQILAAGCPLIAFDFGSAEFLTSSERLSAIRDGAARLRQAGARAGHSWISEDWRMKHSLITIDLGPFIRRAEAGLDLLTRRPLYPNRCRNAANTPCRRIAS